MVDRYFSQNLALICLMVFKKMGFTDEWQTGGQTDDGRTTDDGRPHDDSISSVQ